MRKLVLATVMMLTFSVSAQEWKTSYSNDEMRGTSQKFIMLDSENSVNFDFPYNGGSEMTLTLRSKKTELKEGQKPEDLKPNEALLLISKGQFTCHSYDDCRVSVKFDKEKIQTYSMSKAADGSSDLLFFSSSAGFIKNLKKHKSVIIEAEFFQEGSKQFKFNIENLPE